jgi:hypothetical protein
VVIAAHATSLGANVDTDNTRPQTCTRAHASRRQSAANTPAWSAR